MKINVKMLLFMTASMLSTSAFGRPVTDPWGTKDNNKAQGKNNPSVTLPLIKKRDEPTAQQGNTPKNEQQQPTDEAKNEAKPSTKIKILNAEQSPLSPDSEVVDGQKTESDSGTPDNSADKSDKREVNHETPSSSGGDNKEE